MQGSRLVSVMGLSAVLVLGAAFYGSLAKGQSPSNSKTCTATVDQINTIEKALDELGREAVLLNNRIQHLKTGVENSAHAKKIAEDFELDRQRIAKQAATAKDTWKAIRNTC